jgi:hypothetical protein
MAHKLDDDELVSFKELLMANAIQVDTAVQSLIEKGFFSEQEFFSKMKQVQALYQKMPEHNEKSSGLIDALITDVINKMPLETRVSVADLEEDEFRVLELTQRRYMKHRLDNLSEKGNEELLKECRE